MKYNNITTITNPKCTILGTDNKPGNDRLALTVAYHLQTTMLSAEHQHYIFNRICNISFGKKK